MTNKTNRSGPASEISRSALGQGLRTARCPVNMLCGRSVFATCWYPAYTQQRVPVCSDEAVSFTRLFINEFLTLTESSNTENGHTGVLNKEKVNNRRSIFSVWPSVGQWDRVRRRTPAFYQTRRPLSMHHAKKKQTKYVRKA